MNQGDTTPLLVLGFLGGGGLLVWYLMKKRPPPDGDDYVQQLRRFYRDDFLRRAENDARFVGAAEEFWAATAGITEYIPGEIHSIYLDIYYRIVGGG